jgi:hypothetical protein
MEPRVTVWYVLTERTRDNGHSYQSEVATNAGLAIMTMAEP